MLSLEGCRKLKDAKWPQDILGDAKRMDAPGTMGWVVVPTAEQLIAACQAILLSIGRRWEISFQRDRSINAVVWHPRTGQVEYDEVGFDLSEVVAALWIKLQEAKESRC